MDVTIAASRAASAAAEPALLGATKISAILPSLNLPTLAV
jgi:hypothetical protein